MANIPLPSNIVFTRSGDSVFENVTIWGNTNLNTLNVYGESLFYEDATFKKDVRIEGKLDINGDVTFKKDIIVEGKSDINELLVRTSFGNIPNISADRTITPSFNEMLIGPVTITTGVTVTIQAGATFTVI